MRERPTRKKGGGRKAFVREKALSYSVLRRAWIDGLLAQLRTQRTLPLRTPLDHQTVCIEPDRHRDRDNVYAGAMKILWDVLRKAGLIPNDSSEHVGRCRGWEVVYAHPSMAGVRLYLYEPDDPAAVVLTFRGVLPGWNEWHAATALGARRQVERGL